MDTGRGYLVPLSNEQKQNETALQALKAEHPQHGGTFYVGQNLELNGSKVRVIAISKKTITLKVLPKG